MENVFNGFETRRNEQLNRELTRAKLDRANLLKENADLRRDKHRLAANLKHTQANYLHVQQLNQELKEFINDLKLEQKEKT